VEGVKSLYAAKAKEKEITNGGINKKRAGGNQGGGNSGRGNGNSYPLPDGISGGDAIRADGENQLSKRMGTKNLPEGLRGGSAYRGGLTPQAGVAVLGGDCPAESADENTEQTLKAGRIDEKLLMGCGTGLPRSAPPLAPDFEFTDSDRETHNMRAVAEALKEINPNALTAQDRLNILQVRPISGATVERYLAAVEAITGLGVSKSTFYRWHDLFDGGGIDALKDTRGANNRKIDIETLREILTAVKADTHITNIAKAYCRRLAEKQDKSVTQWATEKPASLAAIYKACDRIIQTDRAAVMLMRGKDAWLNQLPHSRREKIRPNYEWQMDATSFDFMCLKPIQVWDSKKQIMREEIKPVRATVIAIKDHYSGRSVAGIYDSPNSYANARLLRKATNTFGGKPRFLRGDNGADYLSKHFQGALAELGILYIKSRKFTGWDKGSIERFFRSFPHGSIELMPGFIGHSVAQRKKIEAQNASKAEWISGAATQAKDLLLWEELEALLDIYLEKEDQEQGRIAMFNEGRGEIAPVESYELDRAIGKRYTRVWQSTGVAINKIEYNNIYLDLINKSVEVVENIDDIARVWIFDPKTKEYLGEAGNASVAHYTQEEMRSVQKARAKTLQAAYKATERISAEIGASFMQTFRAEIKAKIDAEKAAAILKKDTQEAMDAVNRSIDGAAAGRIEKRLLKQG
jgi:transposase InsO family protein